MALHFHKNVPKIKNAQLTETKSCLHPLCVRVQLLNEKSTDSQVKGHRSIARLTLHWGTYNHKNRSCLPLSSILYLVKTRRKIQAGWQEEIKLRKWERTPFIPLDLNSHAFPLCYRCLTRSLIPLQGKERKEMKEESEKSRQEGISYCSSWSTVRARPSHPGKTFCNTSVNQ